MPLAEPLPQLTEAYVENSRWLMDHLAEVARAYPNQWVAVCAGRVCAADADLGIVTDTVERSGASLDTVYHFVDDGSLIFILSGV